MYVCSRGEAVASRAPKRAVKNSISASEQRRRRTSEAKPPTMEAVRIAPSQKVRGRSSVERDLHIPPEI
jgi:hypothetical protein